MIVSAPGLHLNLQLQNPKPIIQLHSDFCPPFPLQKPKNASKFKSLSTRISVIWPICLSSSRVKQVRNPSFDRHVVKQNKIRFVQKLKTLLLSKPKHFMPISILSKCRSYLAVSRPKSILSMIHRYPTIFELFTIPMPPTPMNATKPLSQLCVRLTPAAALLAQEEKRIKSEMSISLANKLQKLLMMSSHHRLLLSKLVHLAPDLGLPVNFRSRLCNEFPCKFKVVDTSFGRALELVTWDDSLAKVLPLREQDSRGLIVDRPLKFKFLRLRKGLNVKRGHMQYLIKFKEMPDVCPYKTKVADLVKESIEAEKRACAVAREVLGMMVEKRTLVDHLTHFRKEFGLPNKLRGMLLRHPEVFYVSLKGQRDSVFLVEGYDDKGMLLEKDKLLVLKEHLMGLVREGKKVRREKRKAFIIGDVNVDKLDDIRGVDDWEVEDDDKYEDYDDSLDDLFDSEDSWSEGEADDDTSHEPFRMLENGEFWTVEAVTSLRNQSVGVSEPW